MEMKIVVNTSPLIFLSKLNKIDYIKGNEIFIPTQVINEIKVLNETDVALYELINKNLDVLKPKIEETNLLPNIKNLGIGESAVISLAIKRKIKQVLIDENDARKIARLHGLLPRGCLGIIRDPFQQKKISKEQYKNDLFTLLDLGYRIREEIFVELLKEIT